MNGWCHPVGGHVSYQCHMVMWHCSYPTDRPTATTLRLCSSLFQAGTCGERRLLGIGWSVTMATLHIVIHKEAGACRSIALVVFCPISCGSPECDIRQKCEWMLVMVEMHCCGIIGLKEHHRYQSVWHGNSSGLIRALQEFLGWHNGFSLSNVHIMFFAWLHQAIIICTNAD